MILACAWGAKVVEKVHWQILADWIGLGIMLSTTALLEQVGAMPTCWAATPL